MQASRTMTLDGKRIAAQPLLQGMADQGVSRFLIDAAGPCAFDLKRRARTNVGQAAIWIYVFGFAHNDRVIAKLASNLLPLHSRRNAQLPATARTSLSDPFGCCRRRTHVVAFLNFG